MTLILARALADSVWIGASFTVLVWFLMRGLSGVDAASRYRTWCAALALNVLVPVATVVGSSRHPIYVTAPPSAAAANHGVLVAVIGALVIWALVAVFRLVRLLRALLKIRVLKRHCVTIDCEIPLPRHAVLIRPVEPQNVLPSVLGYLRPTILVSESFSELSSESRREILTHEIAHLRRYDDWTALIQQILSCVFWFNPALYVIGFQMGVDRELACDDVVVASTGEPKRYASTLWNVIERRGFGISGLVPGAISEGAALVGRVERLLQPRRHALSSLSHVAPSCAAGLGVFALAVAAHLAPPVAQQSPTCETYLRIRSTDAARTAYRSPSDEILKALSDSRLL